MQLNKVVIFYGFLSRTEYITQPCDKRKLIKSSQTFLFALQLNYNNLFTVAYHTQFLSMDN